MLRLELARRTASVTLLLLIAGIAFTGCGDDAVGPVDQPNADGNGTFQTEFGPASGSFEVLSNLTGDPRNLRPGPFLIRGSIGEYDDDAGTLPVALSVTNVSDRNLPLPVMLTFMSLLPEGVEITDADNGETGAGASIEFFFENDDLVFSSDEESLPRIVTFKVDKGAAIGFTARIDVGMMPGGGAIGGMVWHDENEDGLLDPDEAGIAGAVVAIRAQDREARTRTQTDGSYLFEGLPAGVYTVVKPGQRGLMPTTPSEIQVVLPETDGEVGSFLAANFGCVVIDDGERPPIEVGDYINLKGMYHDDPDRVVAYKISVNHDRSCSPLGRLAGPVTDLNRERRLVEIMGTWVHPHDIKLLTAGDDDDCDGDLEKDGRDHDCPGDDLEAGDRVRADKVVPRRVDDPGPLEADKLKRWKGRDDRVKGVVQRIRALENDDRYGLLVLNTWIEVTPDTEIKFYDDCDDDDDDDDCDDGDDDCDDDDDDDDDGDGEDER